MKLNETLPTHNVESLKTTTAGKKRPNTNIASVVEKLLLAEEQRMQMLRAKIQTLNEDASYHFLMTLLPYLRQLIEEGWTELKINFQRNIQFP